MKKLSIILCLISAVRLLGITQSDGVERTYDLDPKTKIFTIKYVNSKTGDTTKIVQSGEYEVTNKQGIKLIKGRREGGITHPCGCEPRKQGEWTFRYSNGQIDSIGKYKCDNQVGEWKYYYPNGLIKKIEYFIFEQTEYNYLSLRKGVYKEFNKAGQLIIQGQYKVISAQDSVETIDPKTYDFIKIWGNTLKSIKSGTWMFYDSLGVILRKEIYED